MARPQMFPHRHNSDGTYDSICNRCFETVAKVTTEADLRQFEASHVCDAANVYKTIPATRPALQFPRSSKRDLRCQWSSPGGV